MKILLIGNVEFSKYMLQALVEDKANIVGVISGYNSGKNSDYNDLRIICRKHSLEFLRTSNINSVEVIEWIKSKNADVLICVGWSNIIGKDILNLTPKGVIGYHPSALPKNRGRHPLIWALALGLKKTGSSFFQMDEGVDTGDILSQEKVLIEPTDNATTLYKKIINIASLQLKRLVLELQNETCTRTAQNHGEASYWRKRAHKDGEIDWRMSANAVHNLIRALTKPYVGAHFVYQGFEHKVWMSRMANNYLNDSPIENLEPGKVLRVNKLGITIMCSDQPIELIGLENIVKLNVGDYL